MHIGQLTPVPRTNTTPAVAPAAVAVPVEVAPAVTATAEVAAAVTAAETAAPAPEAHVLVSELASLVSLIPDHVVVL